MPGFGTTGRTLEQRARAGPRRWASPCARSTSGAACRQHIQDIGLDPEDRSSVDLPEPAGARAHAGADGPGQQGGRPRTSAPATSREMALGWMHLRRRPHLHVQRERRRAQDAGARAGGLGGRAPGHRTPSARCSQAILDTPVSPELVPPGARAAIGQQHRGHRRALRAARLLPVLLPAPGRGPAQDPLPGRPRLRDALRPGHAAALAARLRRPASSSSSSSARSAPTGRRWARSSLSPRGDWRMPSDASAAAWLAELAASPAGRV